MPEGLGTNKKPLEAQGSGGRHLTLDYMIGYLGSALSCSVTSVETLLSFRP